MRKLQLNPVPTLALSFHDLMALRGIIRAYITYTHRASKPTPARQDHLEVLEGLYTRLTSVPANVSDIAFLLSIAEVAALSGAIKGFCAFVRSKVPPSQERDEILQDIERMREFLLQML
ncbi:MAG TPA: hypothetical protein VKP04_04525 [Ktedonobacteraceae bacterium]|nr:hypothetical protein [Ktedonobacteraceae bacterium]